MYKLFDSVTDATEKKNKTEEIRKKTRKKRKSIYDVTLSLPFLIINETLVSAAKNSVKQYPPSGLSQRALVAARDINLGGQEKTTATTTRTA